jgi:hypothetical protein
MSTWVLVIVITFGAGGDRGAISTVPGYKTEQTCNTTAKEAIERSKLDHTTAFCIAGP